MVTRQRYKVNGEQAPLAFQIIDTEDGSVIDTFSDGDTADRVCELMNRGVLDVLTVAVPGNRRRTDQ